MIAPGRTARVAPAQPSCAFCGKGNLTGIIDFGDVALAGGFLKQSDFANERKFPLRICFCPDCYAVQVAEKIDPSVLFSNYFYFSSAIGTLREHFRDYAAEVVARFLKELQLATVVEIGCNDGILLRPLADQGVGTLIGVDPAMNILKTIDDSRIHIVNDFFGDRLGVEMLARFGKADLVVANNVYAHIADINGVTGGISKILKEDGIFVFEVHYLGKVIQDLQYDMIYHEHLYHYSLLALENNFARHGMSIFDIKPIPIHGGSMRYYVCKNGSRYGGGVPERVEVLRHEELTLGYDRPETYRRFAADCLDRREKLMELITLLRAKAARSPATAPPGGPIRSFNIAASANSISTT
jgi:SAM-dependent methyltransferase